MHGSTANMVRRGALALVCCSIDHWLPPRPAAPPVLLLCARPMVAQPHLAAIAWPAAACRLARGRYAKALPHVFWWLERINFINFGATKRLVMRVPIPKAIGAQLPSRRTIVVVGAGLGAYAVGAPTLARPNTRALQHLRDRTLARPNTRAL